MKPVDQMLRLSTGQPPFRSLASSLIRRIVTVAALCTILAAAIQATITVNDERSRFEQALRNVAATSVPLLSVTLRDMEPEAVRRQLQQIADRPEIAFARLEEHAGRGRCAGWRASLPSSRQSASPTPLQFARPERPWQDEIDLVADGFRTLQDAISTHVDSLDSQVAQRTAELEAALVEIRALTVTDSLTGCYNRRFLDERLLEEVLRGLSRIFLGEMRARIDWVARYGGEEFVIVLPHTMAPAGR